ncbi:phosphoglycerol transferase MdoB-like AlkP superfamily enzyme [Larkinella arboricola]|uniref:Phosphoglycerol transferase MdoB-like AlkP superfamily enzyme n=1 Tax=Larkinella arboricola TaxID=643671 RepID=A0A327X4E5_LARAB|nr:alkaline phosphatase family protein [Larkinella arboricola]RAK00415.1 phosphoglycerol transferase MdoB-like AlkP superfamily enzyme [Larkinella arboricola]
MKSRFRFLVTYLLGWTGWLALNRILFLWYQPQTSQLDSSTLLGVFAHGLRMDLSTAGYLTVLPALLITLLPNGPHRQLATTLHLLTFVELVLVTLIGVADLEVFRTWGFHLDITPLHYLKSPREAAASVASSPIFLLITVFLAQLLVGGYAFRRLIQWNVRRFQPVRKWIAIPALLIATVALIIPIRGGTQLAPMNVSAVYFSPTAFANYAAVTPQWNFIHSFLERNKFGSNPYTFFPKGQAKRALQTLYHPDTSHQSLLNTPRPNVIFIIWESFTAKSVAALNGRPGVTPEFEKLTREGLLFNQIYASGDRSEKGLIALLSGFPAQATASIMTLPSKSAKLPTLGQAMKKAGYQTAFYYGGETEFANIKSYLYHNQFDRIIAKSDFERKDWNSKWGAHDHIVYNRILSDLGKTKQPFFTTFFTLSSHEPFEVPMPTVFPGDDEESLFLNAMYYADRSLGEFITQARKQPWWSNTLIIITADHGHRLPVLASDKMRDFHIPMLWLGGALKTQPHRIDHIGSQTDLAATLLQQLRLDASAFRWSRDLLNSNNQPFAYFAFNNGFGVVQPNRHFVYDNISRRLIASEGAVHQQDIELGQAYEEESYQDFLDK